MSSRIDTSLPEVYEEGEFLVKADLDKVFFNKGSTKSPEFVELGTEVIPAGTIEMWSGSRSETGNAVDKIPDGWLLCDGREVGALDYPDLYARIKNSMDNRKTLKFQVFARLVGNAVIQDNAGVVENIGVQSDTNVDAWALGYIDVTDRCTQIFEDNTYKIHININREYTGTLYTSLTIFDEIDPSISRVISDDGAFVIFYKVETAAQNLDGETKRFNGRKQHVFKLPALSTGSDLNTIKGVKHKDDGSHIVGKVPPNIVGTSNDLGIELSKKKVDTVRTWITIKPKSLLETYRHEVEEETHNYEYGFQLVKNIKTELFKGHDAPKKFNEVINNFPIRHYHSAFAREVRFAKIDDSRYRYSGMRTYEMEFGVYRQYSAYGDVVHGKHRYTAENVVGDDDIIAPWEHEFVDVGDIRSFSGYVRTDGSTSYPIRTSRYITRQYRHYTFYAYNATLNPTNPFDRDWSYQEKVKWSWRKYKVQRGESTVITSQDDANKNAVQAFSAETGTSTNAVGGNQGIDITPPYCRVLFIIKT